jgi:pimeloyl-ACP methyl ester carboxylesterase
MASNHVESEWFRGRRRFTSGLAAGAAGLAATGYLGDSIGGSRVASPWGPAAAAAQDQVEIPAPESVTLDTTKDGVVIKGTYYGGTNKEETVPVLMIHDFGKHNRGEFHRLALGLQKAAGHAVLTIDMRGHGESTLRKKLDGDETLVPDKLKPADFAAMIALDLEAAKRFLMAKQHAKELNIDRLVVIGAGQMGSVVALNWTHQDWSWKQTPFLRQGQDVKALVLLSPASGFKTLKTTPAFTLPYITSGLSVLLVASRTESEYKQLHNRFNGKGRYKPDDESPEERGKRQDLFMYPIDTELRGTALLSPELPVNNYILQFINLRVVQRGEDFPWKSRKRETN